MKTLFRALPLWLILAGLAAWLALAPEESLTGAASIAALLVLGPLAAWLTSSTVTNLPAHSSKRGVYWAITMLAWSVLAILMQGRGEASEAARTFLILSAQLIAVALLWRMIRMRQTPTWRGIGEVAASVAFVALLAGALYWGYEAQTRAIATRAEARWAAIGRPMVEFEKALKPSRENTGSAVLRDVLRSRANALYYRPGTKAAALEPQIEPSPAIAEMLKMAVEVISRHRAPADDLALPAKSLPLLEAQSADLDEMYRRLLAVEPATWASDPHESYAVSVPNFLGIRSLSQLIAADALRREATGDDEGAATAIAAGLRVRAGLLENPTLVSMMIAVAVDAMLYPQQVRLPAAEDGFASIARDTSLWRAEYLRRLQMNAWAALHHIQHPTAASIEAMAIHLSSPLPDWADTLANATWIRRQCAVAALSGAEHTVIEQEATTISLPDFGASRHETVSQAHPSKLDFNSVRATMRIHATLLLREQTELIRAARARVAAGQPVESRDSLVLPGTRWELTADLEKQTVSTRLAGAPDWIIKNETCPREFWLLPVDGSESWQFRPTTRTAYRD